MSSVARIAAYSASDGPSETLAAICESVPVEAVSAVSDTPISQSSTFVRTVLNVWVLIIPTNYDVQGWPPKGVEAFDVVTNCARKVDHHGEV